MVQENRIVRELAAAWINRAVMQDRVEEALALASLTGIRPRDSLDIGSGDLARRVRVGLVRLADRIRNEELDDGK